MATRKVRPIIHAQAHVSLANHAFIPGNPGFCPIANALKDADPDIVTVKVTDKQIVFSRRETQQRYWFKTPGHAVRYLHAVDAILETKIAPEDIDLVLTSADLIRVRDRSRKDNAERLRQAQSRSNSIVSVDAKGGITVLPRHKTRPTGPRPKRVNSEAVSKVA